MFSQMEPEPHNIDMQHIKQVFREKGMCKEVAIHSRDNECLVRQWNLAAKTPSRKYPEIKPIPRDLIEEKLTDSMHEAMEKFLRFEEPISRTLRFPRRYLTADIAGARIAHEEFFRIRHTMNLLEFEEDAPPGMLLIRLKSFKPDNALFEGDHGKAYVRRWHGTQAYSVDSLVRAGPLPSNNPDVGHGVLYDAADLPIEGFYVTSVQATAWNSYATPSMTFNDGVFHQYAIETFQPESTRRHYHKDRKNPNNIQEVYPEQHVRIARICVKVNSGVKGGMPRYLSWDPKLELKLGRYVLGEPDTPQIAWDPETQSFSLTAEVHNPADYAASHEAVPEPEEEASEDHDDEADPPQYEPVQHFDRVFCEFCDDMQICQVDDEQMLFYCTACDFTRPVGESEVHNIDFSKETVESDFAFDDKDVVKDECESDDDRKGKLDEVYAERTTLDVDELNASLNVIRSKGSKGKSKGKKKKWAKRKSADKLDSGEEDRPLSPNSRFVEPPRWRVRLHNGWLDCEEDLQQTLTGALNAGNLHFEYTNEKGLIYLINLEDRTQVNKQYRTSRSLRFDCPREDIPFAGAKLPAVPPAAGRGRAMIAPAWHAPGASSSSRDGGPITPKPPAPPKAPTRCSQAVKAFKEAIAASFCCSSSGTGRLWSTINTRCQSSLATATTSANRQCRCS